LQKFFKVSLSDILRTKDRAGNQVVGLTTPIPGALANILPISNGIAIKRRNLS